MNQEVWDSLNAKIAERDRLQAHLDQLKQDIAQLATNLHQQLDQYRQAAPEA